jgi:hypothetical protein
MRLKTIVGRSALSVALALVVAATTATPATAARMCGGRHQTACGPTQYCAYTGRYRYRWDAVGVCKTRPRICPDVYVGVCGSDGKTYANTCQAERAGVSVAHAGKCPIPPNPPAPDSPQ